MNMERCMLVPCDVPRKTCLPSAMLGARDERDQRACMQQPASRGSSSAHRTHGTSMHRSKQHMTCTCSMMLMNVGPTSPTRCASACGGADPCSGATM